MGPQHWARWPGRRASTLGNDDAVVAVTGWKRTSLCAVIGPGKNSAGAGLIRRNREPGGIGQVRLPLHAISEAGLALPRDGGGGGGMRNGLLVDLGIGV